MNINAQRIINKPKRLLALFSTMVLLAVLAGWFVINSFFGPYKPGDITEYQINIQQGLSTAQIGQILAKENIIANSKYFELFVRLNNVDGKLKAGDYTLSPGMSLKEIVDRLMKGQSINIKFTIPEGYTLKQICEVLVKKGLAQEEKFWRIVREEPFSQFEFLKDLPKDDKRLEGYLFPDTYIVPKGISEKEIIEMMLQRFVEVYNQLPANESGLNFRDTVILASMVELESMVDRDRPIIASVFLNRLRIGMKLDCDATLQYIFPERKARVLYSDLEIDSPYNTYKYKGLPPGPIGSPGRASLEAVHQPAQSKYFYFVAKKDGSGEHVFSETLAEHNSNKKKLGY
ncbi:MAG: endolytic transglycosylase MltG [Clostridia bacterium]|nr:endolytic transglycosylase MltG [Clostridia bacterium]